MELLLHTIAVEPARWTPARVSRSLLEILPNLADADFHKLEIYEPHLDANSIQEIFAAFSEYSIEPVVLSSYLDLARASESEISLMEKRVTELGFKKVRLFPKGDANAGTSDGVQFAKSLEKLARRMPETVFLLETHDGTLADDPVQIAHLVADLALPNVALLYQPTFFKKDLALEQLMIQQQFIRHLHLQNRFSDLSFALLEEGVIPWPQILGKFNFAIDATLEFVPAGIGKLQEFDLAKTLAQARSEMEYVKRLTSNPSVAN